jgi:enoyl-[acyl-carrier-protein] reductase (NADH)
VLYGVIETVRRHRQRAEATSPFRNASQEERVASVLIVFLLALLLAASGSIYFLDHGKAGVSGNPPSRDAVTVTVPTIRKGVR